MVGKRIYLLAGIITLALFVLSLYVGYTIETKSYNKLYDQLLTNSINSESYDLIKEYNDVRGTETPEETCTMFRNLLDAQSMDAASLYEEVYKQETGIIITDKGRYDIMRKQYLLANFKLYLSYLEYKKQCNDNETELVLFFYTAEKECPYCITQGRVLDSIRYD